ncbi:hypothetical protein [Fructobacillus ficulneus]|uniref:Uncharacterized protein n=1 Tax=Fructobacillus ficulneus TaxID=157463 RepID=A0A0K8MFH6_9LACO|nr:hypothetical protein [Fructobacillus ficulneus]GAO99296.1 hypothetical protein FFIC_091230 [Fructobacillus ficulneus]
MITKEHVVFDLNDEKQAEQYRKIFHSTPEEHRNNVRKMREHFAKAHEGFDRFVKAVENGEFTS